MLTVQMFLNKDSIIISVPQALLGGLVLFIGVWYNLLGD